MPGDILAAADLHSLLASPERLRDSAFAAMRSLAVICAERNFDEEAQDLLLRALGQKEVLGPSAQILESLVRSAGLFPFLDPDALSLSDRLAYEYHSPSSLAAREVVFHRPQARVYRELMQGKSVILSAPTSFGKSLVIDAVIASGKYKNVLVVVPTIALIDETRRRLASQLPECKVITHPTQARSDRNAFVLTQERALELADLDRIDFLVIDEFYKLAPGKDGSDRSALLNQVFYSIAKRGVPFYLLGPSITGVASSVVGRLECTFLVERYHTVASDLHRVEYQGDELQALAELCNDLTEPTIVFCQSPKRASAVARYLVERGYRRGAESLRSAVSWLESTYHPRWHFAEAMANGIGVHHGRIPRALAQFAVRAFDAGYLPLLICTSTLIEGVNTKAKNIIIFDNKINREKFDYFTFNNIRGRSGRMFQHFVGHVFLFHEPPPDTLPFVDVPAFTQGDDAPESLLVQLDDSDLSELSRRRVAAYHTQQALSFETIRENVGVSPSAQLAFAEALLDDVARLHPQLYWSGYPTNAQVYAICELLWEHFGGRELGAGSARSAKQLAYLINELRGVPTVTELIRRQRAVDADPDAAVQAVLDFRRIWATFHFPRLLRAADRIQKDVFGRARLPAGDYTVFAAAVESLFTDPAIVALDEYGIPLEVAQKLEPLLRPRGDLDVALTRLRELRVEGLDLPDFERLIVGDAILGLGPSPTRST